MAFVKKKLMVWLVLMSVFLSCQKQESSLISSIRAGSLETDKLALSKIESVSSGIINPEGPIAFNFSENPTHSSDVKLKNIISLSPAIKGDWVLNEKRLIFTPTNPIPEGVEYVVAMDLYSFFPNLKDVEETNFGFRFNALPQEIKFKYNDRALNFSPKEVALSIPFYSTRPLSVRELKKSFQVEGALSPQKISFTATDDSNKNYQLDVLFERGKKEASLEIGFVNPKSKVFYKPTYFLKVSKKQVFDLSEKKADYVQNKLRLTFSTGLDEEQELDGLIFSRSGEELRFERKENVVDVYFQTSIPASVNLVVNKELRSAFDEKLKQTLELNFVRKSMKPKIVFDQEKGGILATSGEVNISFRSVALSAIDVDVIRVFPNNIIQFLQENDSFADSHRLARVGDNIVTKTLNLEEKGKDLTTWQSFSLSLTDLLQVEPGAAYQVRLRMRPSYSLYPGADNIELPLLVEGQDYWKTVGNDYYYGDRGDPLKSSYYHTPSNETRFNFLATNLGIIAKSNGKNDWLFFTTNLLTGKPEANVQIDVYNYQNQLLNTLKTNSEGMVRLENSDVFVIRAKKGKHISYLKISETSVLSTSSFNTYGSASEEGIRGFFFGERGVWRPGDDIHLFFMLEDRNNNLPDDYPVLFELSSPAGRVVDSQFIENPVDGIYQFKTQTLVGAESGPWRASARFGNQEINFTVPIELVKPNRLELGLENETKDEWHVGKNRMLATGKWLHGDSAEGLRSEWEISLQTKQTVFEDYSQYIFDSPNRDLRDVETQTIFNGTLGKEGQWFNFDLNIPEEVPGKLKVAASGKIYEPGGEFSISNRFFSLSPYSSYVGLSTSVKPGEEIWWVKKDEQQSVGIVNVDESGKPQAGATLEYEVYQISWHWWWENSEDLYNVIDGRNVTSVMAGTVETNTKGEASFVIDTNELSWGRHIVLVRDIKSGHETGQVFYTSWWADERSDADDFGASRLDFSSNKTEYEVGDLVSLRVPSNTKSHILVSLETGSRVLDTFWVAGKANETTVSFKATGEMSPSLYANIMVIQEASSLDNSLPLRMYGIQPIKVLDVMRVLNPIITAPKEIKPLSRLTLKVSEKNSKAMSYVVMAVDEGLLGLTNFQTPNPSSFFNKRVAHGVKTWDFYDDVLLANKQLSGTLFSLGGGAEIEENNAREQQLSERFKPVVKVLGPFTLAKGENATHTIDVPAYLGKLRFMVVASHNSSQFGRAEASTEIKSDFMLQTGAPRVLSAGDELELPVTLWNSKNLTDFQLKVKSPSSAIQISPVRYFNAEKKATEVNATLASGQSLFIVPIKVLEEVGTVDIKISAMGGGNTYSEDLSLYIRSPNSFLTESTNIVVKKGKSKKWMIKKKGVANTHSVSFEVSQLPPLALDHWLKYLIRYPYGCAEQTTSTLMGQLHLPILSQLNSTQKVELTKNIEEGIEKLQQFQLKNGGFSLWEGGTYDEYVSAYLGHFLLLARDSGHTIPDNMIERWRDNEKNSVKKSYEMDKLSTYRMFKIAYQVYVLALANTPDLSGMNRLRESSPEDQEILYLLASAYQLSGSNKIALSLVKEANKLKSKKIEHRYYESNLRLNSLGLLANSYVGDEKKAFKYYQKISDALKDEKHLSTNAVGWALVSVAHYNEVFKVTSSFNFILNKQDIQPESRYFTSSEILTGDKELQFENTSEDSLFVTINQVYSALAGEEKEVNNGVAIKLTQSPEASEYALSEEVVYQVIVSNQSEQNFEDLMVTTVAPSGWELINTNLGNAGVAVNRNALREDWRDDRVYTALSLEKGKKTVLEYRMIPTMRGKIYQPAVTVESMYQPQFYASTKGRWVTIQ